MIRFLRALWKDKRGNALIIAGASMPLIIGAAGLGTDTVQWFLWKRELQRAADSAAFAGVQGRIQGISVNGLCDATSTVGRDLAINNQVRVGNADTSCTVQNSPASGSYSSDPNAVRVALSVQKSLGFSSMFLAGTPTISASATATVVPSGEYCVISLENTATTGIAASGNATVDMGCGMITNSISMTAAVATGSSVVTASPIAAVGGIGASNNWGTGTVLQPFTLAQDDPFQHVYPPAASTYPSGNCPNLTVNSNTTKTTFTANSDYKAMGTNTYCFGSITIRGSVTFPANSVIVLDGGSLQVNAQASATCDGCTFVLTNRNTSTTATIGNVDLNGGATLNLKAPGTAATGDAANYRGIMIYQDRRATTGTNANQQSSVNGNASSFLQGALYFPSQQLTFNGTAGMSTSCLQLVARRVSYSGNLNISNSCPLTSGASAFTGKKIRLVA
ncbi:hypothetical protein H8M03_04715 [Sphingomonas sabuli]|uniref:Putative Flp pilus-assembly TadG-like N-terminal domain-containing protein n=1 Tax=Sphingomonas sabuli TaxID=2764186 RepID=A0A7G9L4T2_9SPHN|nr:TadE/TadG family type IV pilus assembly protein [Sphingomonas sabuli]QNM83631.1 hypothetical protein H8M03_04715 [Sphingomonas sabuli]